MSVVGGSPSDVVAAGSPTSDERVVASFPEGGSGMSSSLTTRSNRIGDSERLARLIDRAASSVHDASSSESRRATSEPAELSPSRREVSMRLARAGPSSSLQ